MPALLKTGENNDFLDRETIVRIMKMSEGATFVTRSTMAVVRKKECLVTATGKRPRIKKRNEESKQELACRTVEQMNCKRIESHQRDKRKREKRQKPMV